MNMMKFLSNCYVVHFILPENLPALLAYGSLSHTRHSRISDLWLNHKNEAEINILVVNHLVFYFLNICMDFQNLLA